MSIWAIISILYGLVGVGIYRPLAGHFAYKSGYKELARTCEDRYLYPNAHKDGPRPNWGDGYFYAFWASWIWPLLIVFTVMPKVAPAIGAEKQAQLEAEIKDRKKRDKDLGLPPYEYGKITS